MTKNTDAVTAEREACAALAEKLGAPEVAAAIRARTTHHGNDFQDCTFHAGSADGAEHWETEPPTDEAATDEAAS